ESSSTSNGGVSNTVIDGDIFSNCVFCKSANINIRLSIALARSANERNFDPGCCCDGPNVSSADSSISAKRRSNRSNQSFRRFCSSLNADQFSYNFFKNSPRSSVIRHAVDQRSFNASN
ncbi:hypothetical protein DERP_006030, partial [Dermatophagoides pteronyssinus]